MEKDIIQTVREEAGRVLSDNRGSHDWEHTERVYNLCMHIGKLEGADLDVLALAAYLHDIGRRHQDESKGRICHAHKGAEMAREILEKAGSKEGLIEAVIHCIETHRSKGLKIPISLEARVLYDADKLDGIGAVGIGRAFMFASEVGARLHNKNVDIHNTKPYTVEDTPYREYLVVLSKIKDKITTAEGKRIAEGRHRFMVEYFDRLNKEADGLA